MIYTIGCYVIHFDIHFVMGWELPFNPEVCSIQK